MSEPGGTEDPDELSGPDHEADLEWAGLDAEVAQVGYVAESTTGNLVGYFRDCAVANQRGLKLYNVFDGTGAQVVGVPADAWVDAVADGIEVEGREALNLALANETSPFDKPLLMGALFVLGRQSGRPGRPRAICAPLLVGAVSQSREATGATFLLEGDVGVNLSLLADLIGVDRDNEEEVQLRFETLMDLVPDAPLASEDVAAFCTALDHQFELPFDVPAFKGFAEADLAAELAEGGDLRLLPVSAVFIGKEAAELSVIRELDAIGQSDAADSALVALLEPETVATSDVAGVGEAGAGTAHVRPADWHDDIELIELTDTQRRIVASARVEPLTVVTGPPGTGKSYTIAAVALDHLLAGKTVLVSSGTEKAVDVVTERLGLLGGPYVVAISGNRSSQRALADHIDQVTGPAGAPSWYAPAQVEAERATYFGLRAELQALEGRLEETLAREGALAFHLQAVEKGAELLDRYRVEGVDLAQVDALREKIRVEPDAGWWRRRTARRALEHLRGELSAANKEAPVDELEGAVDLAHHCSEITDIEAAIGADPNLHRGWQQLATIRVALLTQGAKVLRMQRSAALAELLADQPSRLALKKFAQALKAAQHRAKKQLLEQVPVEVLLQAFPCWASTDRYLSHILPLRAGLFDLAIVDEASQVDLGAATPVIFRGKRALVVGDPKQLRFVSFLSAAAETAALARHEVPASFQVTHRFSRRSLFDVGDDAVPQRATFILDEHFRSQPHIIGFSNDRFYDRAMRIMTQRPHSEGAKAIDVRFVGGRKASPANRNDAELEAAMEVVHSVIEEAEGGGPVRTIGLLSPFRDQANALNKMVTERFPQYIAPHGIVCGTAHSLQGDERDVVVFSTVIDPGFHHGSLRFLETPNLFNVAITRAAQRLVVVTSVEPKDLPGGETNYLALLMRHAERPADPAAQSDAFRSEFEREVAEALRQRGLVVISAYPSCGYEIDLVVSDGQHSIAVECDGHPSHFNADGSYTTEDIIRHIRLTRAGWQIYRLPLSEWRADRDGQVRSIAEYLTNPPARPVPSTPELPPPARQATAAATRAPARPAKKAASARKTTKKPATSATRLPVTSSRCTCGGKWVLRRGRYGTFYGCSRYPRCRRTRSAR